MSRIIKFRYWNDSDKEFIYFDKYAEDSQFVIGFNFGAYSFDGGRDWTDINPDYLQQYTGLKDKEGVEIYEGDIIKSHSPFLVGFGIYEDTDYYLHTGFTLQDINKIHGPFGLGERNGIANEFIVVGNIFQNLIITK